MRAEQFVEIIQTLGIISIASLIGYVVIRLERALNAAAEKLQALNTHQQATLDSINKIWTRITEIETRTGVRNDFMPVKALRATLTDLTLRLEALENARPVDEDPPIDHD